MIGERILVVAAHPDDEVLGAGGTIARARARGAHVTALIVSDGSSAQYPGDTAVRKKKDGELRRAHEILGTSEVIHWDFPDMRLDTIPHIELNDAIAGCVREGNFDTVLVHSPVDINRDHGEVFNSVMVATRPTPGQHVRRVLSYAVNSSTEWGGLARAAAFSPNCYVDIGSTIDAKLDALACYESELREAPHPRSLDAVRVRASVYGSEVGCAFAEAFQLVYAVES